MITTTLFLVRHGQTSWNLEGRFQGQADEHLNVTGRIQAETVAAGLARMEPDLLWSSPLNRARDTASCTAKLTGLTVHTDERLAEINVGTWSGRLISEVMASEPESVELWRAGKDFRRSPTGETALEVATRMGSCLNQLIAEHPGKRIAVVGHGFAIRVGIAHLMGVRPTVVTTMRNAHLAVLISKGKQLKLAAYNVPPSGLGVDSNVHPS